MIALHLLWKGLSTLLARHKARMVAAFSPNTHSFLPLLCFMALAVGGGLGVVAIAFALGWLFLAFVTSPAEARSIVLLAVSTVLLGMSVSMMALSIQALLARFFARRWATTLRPKPHPMLATSALIAFVLCCGCLAFQGLDAGAGLAIRVAGVAMLAALALSALRALCAAPQVVRDLQQTGFDQLSAHQKLRVLSERRAPPQDSRP